MTSPLEQCRDLPAQIMNLPAGSIGDANLQAAYLKGHQVARHAAAELAAAALAAAEAALAAQSEPVACVTECEACFTPDACQLRGKCDHYAAEQLRVKKAPLYAAPVAAPVAQPLPARFVLFALRDLKADRKRLDGFLALGNEVKRAAEYDEWIAALEAYCGSHGIAPKEPA